MLAGSGSRISKLGEEDCGRLRKDVRLRLRDPPLSGGLKPCCSGLRGLGAQGPVGLYEY